MILVFVPAGQFLMGSSPLDGFGPDLSPYENEFPQHEVQVRAFWIDQTEVTNAQYQLCVEDGHCSPPKKPPDRQLSYHFDDPSYARHPVVNVTWYQAVAYCTWVEARLPSEQEWGYAARGPDSFLFPWGNSFHQDAVNYCDSNCSRTFHDAAADDGYAETAPVGTYPGGASWVGALDMLGNAWEWVWDWYELYEGHRWHDHLSSYPPQTYRILRGGGWDTHRNHIWNAFRNGYFPHKSTPSIGFRCVTDVQP
jgi:formylglycine-generating enzyme required for sulfatase activity